MADEEDPALTEPIVIADVFAQGGHAATSL